MRLVLRRGYTHLTMRRKFISVEYEWNTWHKGSEIVTANDISIALKKRFSDSREFVYAEEVGLTTGGNCRRLDMICVNCYWSNNFRIDGFEYKISTADLCRELSDPSKHVDFFDYIDFYTLVCPAEVVNPLYDIIPKNWGVLIVNEDHTTKYRRKPLALHDKDYDRKISRGFFASFVRAVNYHKPSKLELKAEYDRGMKDGKERIEDHYRHMQERLTREAKKLEDYDTLRFRLRLYGDDSIDEIIDEFEAFRKLEPDFIKTKIDGTINSLTKLKEELFSAKDKKQV